MPVAIVASDHRNKPEADLAKAREWCNVGGVDAIFKMIASSVAIAAFEMAKEKHKIAIASGPGVSALTEKSCLPRGIHWAHDTYVLAVGAGQTVASLLGEARNGSSGEFIPGRPIMSKSFHLGQSGDRR